MFFCRKIFFFGGGGEGGNSKAEILKQEDLDRINQFATNFFLFLISLVHSRGDLREQFLFLFFYHHHHYYRLLRIERDSTPRKKEKKS